MGYVTGKRLVGAALFNHLCVMWYALMSRGQSDSLGIEDHKEISSIENYYEKISEKTIEITPRHRTSHLMTFNTNSVSN